MFKFLPLLLALCLAGTGFCCRESPFQLRPHQAPAAKVTTVRDGKVVVITGATMSPVVGEVTLPTGSRILPEGFIVFPDGRREHLTENRWVGFDGAYVAADPTPSFEGYYIESGRTYVMRGSVPTVVTEEVVLDNGIRVLPAGEYITREGERHRFRYRRDAEHERDFRQPRTHRRQRARCERPGRN